MSVSGFLISLFIGVFNLKFLVLSVLSYNLRHSTVKFLCQCLVETVLHDVTKF